MSEIIEVKVGNPKNSTSKNWVNFSQPWNMAFFQSLLDVLQHPVYYILSDFEPCYITSKKAFFEVNEDRCPR